MAFQEREQLIPNEKDELGYDESKKSNSIQKAEENSKEKLTDK